MGLFSPWFLAGLAALGLPLWLHLLRQFRRTPQPFSSLMFFERRVQSSTKHRRLRYLRLLALRLLLLSLLALLFAEPFIKREARELIPRKLEVLVVDNSFSMRYGKHLAEAKAAAVTLLNDRRARAAMQIGSLANHVVMLSRAETDRSAAKADIESIQQSDESSSYGEFTRAMRLLEQSTNRSLDIHLFTDAQQSSMPASFADLQLGPHSTLTIHDVERASTPNWGVLSATVPAVLYADSPVRVSAVIAGWQTPERARKVSLVLDGRTVASKQVTIPECGKVAVEFTDVAIPYGPHRGEIRIEPEDALPDDDVFRFPVERADPGKVLFLYVAGNRNPTIYYRAALEAASSVGLKVQSQPLGLDSLPDLASYSIVVLNDPGKLASGQDQQLQSFVARGGSLLLGVGLRTSSLGVVPLAGNSVAATTHAQGASVISGGVLSAETFSGAEFVATSKITLKPEDHILATFADSSPLLFERQAGEGMIMTFASTFDNSNSDFPLHSSYLSFVAETAKHLSRRGTDQAMVTVGGTIVVRQSRDDPTSADVIGPDGKHAIPLAEATHVMVYSPDREGFYQVHPAGGKQILVAANADRRESDLTKISSEDLVLWRNTSSGNAVPAKVAGEVRLIPVSFWRYVLILCLVSAIVESVFAARYLSAGKDAG